MGVYLAVAKSPYRWHLPHLGECRNCTFGPSQSGTSARQIAQYRLELNSRARPSLPGFSQDPSKSIPKSR